MFNEINGKLIIIRPFSINKEKKAGLERQPSIPAAQFKTGASVYCYCAKSIKARGLKFCMLQDIYMKYI